MDNKLKERKEPKWSVKGSYNISRCVYGYLQKGAKNSNLSMPEYINMIVIDYFSSEKYDKRTFDRWFVDLKNYFVNLSSFEMFTTFAKYIGVFATYSYLPIKEDKNNSFAEVDKRIEELFTNAGYGKLESKYIKNVARFSRYKIIKDLFAKLYDDEDIKCRIEHSKNVLNGLLSTINQIIPPSGLY